MPHCRTVHAPAAFAGRLLPRNRGTRDQPRWFGRCTGGNAFFSFFFPGALSIFIFGVFWGSCFEVGASLSPVIMTRFWFSPSFSPSFSGPRCARTGAIPALVTRLRDADFEDDRDEMLEEANALIKTGQAFLTWA